MVAQPPEELGLQSGLCKSGVLVALEPALDGALTAGDASPQSDHLCPLQACCLPTLRASRRVSRAQGLAGYHGTIAVGAEVKGLLFQSPLGF